MSWTDIRHIIYNNTAALKTLFGTARSFRADLASVGWWRHSVSSRAFNQRWCLISPKMSYSVDFSHPDKKFDHLFTPAGTLWQALSTEDLLFCFFQATGRAGVLFFFLLLLEKDCDQCAFHIMSHRKSKSTTGKMARCAASIQLMHGM